MKARTRDYEVELDGVKSAVRVQDLGPDGTTQGRRYRVWIGESDPVEVIGLDLGNGDWSLLAKGRSWEAGIHVADDIHEVDILGVRHDLNVIDPKRKALRISGNEGGAVIKSQMPGRVIRVLVEPGQAVKKGSPLLVLEAMKMENEIRSPREGTVKRLAVHEGDLVEARALLVELA